MTYGYDDLDRLKEVVTRDSNGALWHKSEYVYDSSSRKAISREYSWNGTAWTLNSEKRRLFSGLDVVQERDGANAVIANVTRDGNIGGILARSTDDGHFYYHYDGSGNVTELTDSTQTSVAEYSYDAYGVTLTSSGVQASDNPYRYQTKEVTSAGYDFGYRTYLPNVGRWLNRDPIRENGGLNLYGYVGNDPVNNADEHGLFVANAAAAGVGGALSALSNLLAQLLEFQGRWECVDWGKVLIAFTSGAIAGALFPVYGATTGGAILISIFEELLQLGLDSALIDREIPGFTKFITTVILGGAAGKLGGPWENIVNRNANEAIDGVTEIGATVGRNWQPPNWVRKAADGIDRADSAFATAGANFNKKGARMDIVTGVAGDVKQPAFE